MANDVSIRVKAQDNASGPLNKISSNINKFSNDVKAATKPLTNFANSLKNLSTMAPGVYLIGKAVSSVAGSVKNLAEDLTKSFAEVERGIKTLDFAAKINENLGASSRELQNFASDLERQLNYTFAGGDLVKAINSLSFDKTADQIKRILPVAADLSAALGVDLQTAVNQLNGTFSGSVGQLGKMFPELKNLSEEALRSGEAVEMLSRRVKGAAEELSNSISGSMLATETIKGNLKEELGYWVSEFFEPIRKEINKIGAAWVDALSSRRTLKQAKEAVKNNGATKEDYEVLLNDAIERRQQVLNSIASVEESRTRLVSDPRSGVKNSDIDKTISELKSRSADIAREITKYSNNISQLDVVETKRAAEAQRKADAEKKAAEAKAAAQASELQAQKDAENAEKERLAAEKAAADQLEKQMKDLARAESDAARGRQKLEQEWQRELEELAAAAQAQRDARWNNASELIGQAGELGEMVNMFINGSGWIGVLIKFVSSLSSSLSAMSKEYSAFQNIISEIASEAVPRFVEEIKAFIGPFLDSIKPLGEIIGNLLSLIFSVLNAFIGPINKRLTEGLQVISGFLSSFLGMFSSLMDNMGVIIELSTYIIDIARPLLYAVNAILTFIQKVNLTINYFFNALSNAIIDLYNVLNGWGQDKSWVTTSDGKALSFETVWGAIGDLWQDWSALELGQNNTFNQQAWNSGGSNGNMAHYTAAKDVTVNIIYDHAYVNGDAEAIALNLRKELQRIDKLGY